MKAAVLLPPSSDLVIEEVRTPPLGPHDVLIRIEASGVCRSDLTVIREVLGSASPEPMVLGHEGSGTVLEIGREVTRCALGDRVIAAFAPACGNCPPCLRAETHLCIASRATSASDVIRTDGTRVQTQTALGTFAELMTASELAVVPVVTDVPAEQLALIGCGATTGAGAALWTAQVQPGSTVAVYGCGGVGQFAIQGARIAGASRIFAVDPVAFKREQALHSGATDVIDPTACDATEEVRAATGGFGADYAFEVIGSPETIRKAFETARRGGTVVIVGMTSRGATVTFDGFALFRDAKRILGSYYGSVQIRKHMPMLVDLIETGRLDVASAVTRKLRLEDVNQALTDLEAGTVIRSVICP